MEEKRSQTRTSEITSEYVSVTETAKIIRATLKRNFPDCKFSVVSKKYTGGASIDITYTDYLPEKQIEEVVKQYEGADFDGSQDLKTYTSSLHLSPEGKLVNVHYRSDYIFVSRKYSENYSWMLCSKLDLRTVPTLDQQLDNFFNSYRGTANRQIDSMLISDNEVIIILGAHYDEYQIQEVMKSLELQGYKNELIFIEEKYQLKIQKIRS